MNASLTEAQSYSREARRAEELANRLESQASFFEGNSAAGSLNLSQAYREWGLAEIERNRDFYGNVRFDDVAFQLSPEGQALQAKFIESYAEQLRDGIEDRLVLAPGQPVSRPDISDAEAVRSRASSAEAICLQRAAGGCRRHSRRSATRLRRPVASGSADRESASMPSPRDAQGASAEAADDVKEW